jgi:NAD+ kinase
VKSVAIVAHHERPEAATLARVATEWLADHGIDAWVHAADADALDVGGLGRDRPISEADLVVSLGGDGTMLRTVRLLDGASVPVLGVNLGVLGYLTEVEPWALTDSLDGVRKGPEEGAWHLDERLMLDVDLTGSTTGAWRALNEAVVEKLHAGHTIRLLARIDGAPFTSYAADGLIVATPTGSTAYSLSARGPVVSPRHRALLLTPVAPHMLFDRTLVLDPSEVIEIEVIGLAPATLAVDGQPTATLVEGDTVRCTPSEATARFVRFGDHRYHQILKAKFGLTDR